MKHGILAQPDRQWEGFRPTVYFLDSEKVVSLPLARVGGNEQQPTTIRDVLRSLKGRKIDSIENVIDAEIKTDEEVLVLKGAQFNRALLEVLLSLQKDGIAVTYNDLFVTRWFWFDEDWNLRDVMGLYSFFVVSGDKIVRECVRFVDRPNNGFDPSVFLAEEPSYWNWRHDRYSNEAEVRYWYRKFYKETRTGQLMVLRPDVPKLHYYALGRFSEAGFSLLFENISRLTSKVPSLLWVLIIAAIVAVLLLRR